MFSKVRCKWAKNRKKNPKIKVCNTEDIVHSHIQVFNLRECSRTVFYITEPIFYPRHGRCTFYHVHRLNHHYDHIIIVIVIIT